MNDAIIFNTLKQWNIPDNEVQKAVYNETESVCSITRKKNIPSIF